MRQKQVTEQKLKVRKAQSKEPLTEGIQKKRKKQRNWASMSVDELFSFGKGFIEERGIKNRSSLQKADCGLYGVLRKRNLLDAVIPEKRRQRDWVSMTNKELISFTKKFIEENGIKNRNSLEKADGGLYYVLWKRTLLDAVIPEKYGRDWSSVLDKKLVSHAKNFMEDNAIKSRIGLIKADQGLYLVLRKRNLLDAVIPNKRKQRPLNFFAKMNDSELLTYAKKTIEEKWIKGKKDLKEKESGLILALRKRNLLGIVFSEKKKRRCRGFFTGMKNDELVSYAGEVIKEKGIKNRNGLEKADSGLYETLRIRHLLNAVFSDIEQARKTAAVKQVVEAMKEFGGSE